MVNLEFYLQHYNYWISVLLFMIGLYTMIAKKNLIKKFLGLNIVDTSIYLFFISMGDKSKAIAPIIHGEHVDPTHYSNPLPSVLILTAIVVAIGLTATALSLSIRIYEEYGTLNSEKIEELW
ncbi:Na+/H+ antiporter subunit C [archaeon SCG-AAA382B04]|nr:Na+/H+ antiporter subunit C [archaeon SCG-AAA382B04]